MTEQILHWTIFTFFFFPLFFLPLTPDFYEYNKFIFLVFFSLFLNFWILLKNTKETAFSFFLPNFFLPLFFLSSLSLFSALFSSNLSLALTTPLSTGTLFFGLLFYLALSSQNEKIFWEKLFLFLSLEGLLLSFYLFFLYLGLLPPSGFTPAGSLLSTTGFLAILAVYLLSRFFSLLSIQEKSSAFLHLLLFLPIISSVGFSAFHLLTDQKPLLLPFPFGWAIFLETLKNLKTFLLGVGPTNFLAAFTLAKPLEINSSPFWNTIFTTSSSFLLNLATETGAPALVFFSLIFLSATKLLLKKKEGYLPATNSSSPLFLQEKRPFLFSLLFALLWQAFLPSSLTIFLLTLILLASLSEKKTLFSLSPPFSRIFAFTLFFLFSLFSLGVFYFTGRAYLAEVYFKKSLDELLNKNGSRAYQWQQKAIFLNPYLDRYHLLFSQTSLALSNVLAGKENLTEEDKQRIPKLTQQGITEAQRAIALNRVNSVNWENLAATYLSLANFAEGSLDWAISAYQQKIELDPLSPTNYLSLGKAYLYQKKTTEAEKAFRMAVSLKNDWEEAHFQLAQALLQQEKFPEALSELKIAQSLLPPESEKAKQILQQIKEISPKIPESSPD